MEKVDIELLQKLISTPSVFPKEENIAVFIDSWVKNNIRCKRVKQNVGKGRSNLLFTKGKGSKSILLSGHLDTVPVVEGWKTNPFKPTVKNGKLFGLGAWDMKAGLYIILSTLKNFEPKNITLKVALSVDEENFSIGVHKIIDSGFCDDVDFVLVPEPGFIHGEKGIAIGRAGRATFVVKVKGTSAHGSYPKEGINAIDQATIFLSKLSGLSFSTHKELGNTEIYPRRINSEAKGFSVPDECEIELDSKLVVPDKPETILKRLKDFSKGLYTSRELSFLPEVSYKSRPTPFCSPYQIEKGNKYIKISDKVLSSKVGKAKLYYRDSVADECVFVERLNIPVVTIGPSGANAHKPNEYVEISSLERAQDAYLKILEEIDRIAI